MTAERDQAGPDFATLLRERRRAAGLTQAELAARSGVAVRTVREVERGRTARPQRTTARLLADALPMSPVERAEFLAVARGEPVRDYRLLAGSPGVPLPPAPPLVGRAAELAHLVELLADADGPVALVGLAGAGKSVLALALAHQVADRFPAGAAGIAVDEQGDAEELLRSIAFVFGTDQPEDLPGEPALLLLDAVDRAPRKVRAVCEQLPLTVQLITTGRRPLDLPGEVACPLAPLELPPASASFELADAGKYPAVRLFLDRLGQVRPEPLGPDEVPALVGLVRRVGGLPLALELAAAHGRLLRVPQILQRYGDRVLDLGLDGEQPLREAVASSYRLLTPVERRALRRLAVFRNRWSVELAEELLGDVGDPVPLLDRLVGLGLAGVRGAREHRFRLLDVVRDFAIEQAEALGELSESRRAHAVVITRLARRAAPGLAGPNLPVAAARLDDLASDVWAALNHAANDDPHTALELAAQLPRWWRFRGRDVVGRRWLRRLLDDPRTADADQRLRALAAVGSAQLAQEHGEGSEELAAVERAVDVFKQLGDVSGELAARSVLHALWVTLGGYEKARAHTEAALVVATRAGRLRDATVAQTNLTWHEIRTGNLPGARRRLAAVDRLAAQCGEHRLRVLAAANLAEVARLEGRLKEAAAIGNRVLARLGELGDPGHRHRVRGTVGQALAALGRVEEAERVLAALRADWSAGAALDGVCAAIEARLALSRGDQVAAAEWFAAAVQGFAGGPDLRDVLEALLGQAACTADPARRAKLLSRLDQVRREGGFTLLPPEQALLDRLG